MNALANDKPAKQTEAEAAQQAGVYAVVVDRPGNAALTTEDRERFAVVTSLCEL